MYLQNRSSILATYFFIIRIRFNLNMPKTLLLLLLALPLLIAYTDPSLCTSSSQFYDPVLLQCTSCPSNTGRAGDFTYCNCSTSYYANPDVIGFNSATSCLALNATYAPATQVVSIYGLDGTLSPAITSCTNSYPNSLNTRCIPCGAGMTYSATNGCQCPSSSNQYAINGQCYTSTASWTPTQTSVTDILGQQQAQVGCKQYNLIQSCNLIMNRCVLANYVSTNFYCQFLATLQTSSKPDGLPTYTFSSQITDSIGISASSVGGVNTTSVKSTFNFMLVEYNADGSINDIKPLDSSIFSCTLSAQDIVDMQGFGGVFYRTCTTARTFSTQYLYDIYVQTVDGSYAEIPVKIGNNYYKRFTPNGYPSADFVYTTVPPLQVPVLILSNTAPYVRAYSKSSDPTLNTAAFLGVILAGTMVIFILAFYRYMKYNPDQNNDPYYCFKAIFLFLIYIVKYIAVGIHIFLLCFSGYIFCFYKFQRTIYLVMIDYGNDTGGVYQLFSALFYMEFSFLMLAVFIEIFNLTNSTDYFLIDWEKEKELGRFEMGRNKREVSIWRKVLLVNELYELSVNRIINVEMVSLFSVLFLAGLQWIHLGQLVPNTSYNLNNENSYYISPILNYFIVTFVILAIAVVQFLIRHAIKIWWPLPIEDFVDLCSVSNISIIIFDEALHGYYIHGMNPLGQSEGSLAYIESMFEKEAKAFGKSRSFQLDDIDQCQTFEVVFPFEIRQAFQVKYKSRFNQKLAGKAYNTSIISNPIPEMLNEEDYKDLQEITNSMLQSFKYYLQGVKTSMLNVRERSFWQKVISCPIDTATMGKLPVFFKDPWHQFSNVLLSGHEFLLLFNFINFVNIFFIATSNIYYSFFIAFIFEKITSLLCGFFIKRNISRNTLIDDKFFA